MTTATPRVDLGAVTDWLGLMYPRTAGYIQVVSTGNWVGRAFSVDRPRGEIVDHVAALDEREPQGIYTRVTTLTSPPDEVDRRGGAALTASLPALWADIDVAGPGHKHVACEGGDECDHLRDGRRTHRGRVLPLPPDREAARAIVESAYLPPATLWVDSGGGLYPIWKLHGAHPVTDDLAEIALLSARWQELITIAAARLGYHYGTGVGDLARVLRLPGTWNRKTDTPRLCHVLSNEAGTYSLADLFATLEQAREALPTPDPPAPRRPPRARPGDDVKPGTDFAERVDWSDNDSRWGLLGLLGWRETYRLSGGERGWLRPDGTSGLSATTGRGGHDNLWVFSTETPFPTQEVVSKFEAYRIIHGHPDAKSAALALNAHGFGTPAIHAAPNGRAAAVPPPEYVWPDDAAPVRPVAPSPNGSHGTAQPVVEPVTFVGSDTDGWTVKPEAVPEQRPEWPPEDPDAEEDEEVDTWLPVDLGPYLRGEITQMPPSLGLTRSDGLITLYPGREHAVIGEMESGKSWWALACAAAELLAERHVVYIHFEESDPLSTVERLRELGCADNEILTYFHFVGPSRPIKPRQRKRLAKIGASLVVLDGVNEGMSLHRAGIRDEDGAAEWRRIIVKAFKKNGAAVLSLDHVVKDVESRGRYALGSIHKGNAIDGCQITLEPMEAFGRGQRGASAVYVTKDRPGFLRQHGRATSLPGKTFMGVLVVDDTRTKQPDLDLKFWAPAEPEPDTDPESDARTADEQDNQRVLDAIKALASRGVPATLRNVQAEAGGKNARVRDAVARLVVSGLAVEMSGERNARVFFSADDPRITPDRTVVDDVP